MFLLFVVYADQNRFETHEFNDYQALSIFLEDLLYLSAQDLIPDKIIKAHFEDLSSGYRSPIFHSWYEFMLFGEGGNYEKTILSRY